MTHSSLWENDVMHILVIVIVVPTQFNLKRIRIDPVFNLVPSKMAMKSQKHISGSRWKTLDRFSLQLHPYFGIHQLEYVCVYDEYRSILEDNISAVQCLVDDNSHSSSRYRLEVIGRIHLYVNVVWDGLCECGRIPVKTTGYLWSGDDGHTPSSAEGWVGIGADISNFMKPILILIC